MSRRTALAIIGVVLAVAGLLGLLARRDRGPSPAAGPEDGPGPTAGPPREVTLYFPGDGDRLEAEEREIPPGLRGPALARHLLEALLSGPASDGLHPPLPEGTTVDFVQPAEHGMLYVSLAPPEGEAPPRYGSRAEILAVYSLVNTLCANMADVDRVAFLWNGVEPMTFAGNLDTRRPVSPEPRWIRSPG
jgi:hypothetical protein